MRRLTEVEWTRNLSARSLSNVQLNVSIVRLRRLKLTMNKRLSLNMEEIQIILFWSLRDVAMAMDAVMVDVVVLENNTR